MKAIAVLMILVMIISASVMIAGTTDGAETPEPEVNYIPVINPIDYTDHDNIIIEDNFAFTEPDFISGVTGGSGTEFDPYIIEGWEIDMRLDTGSCIFIANTDAYVIIRNCYLHDTQEFGMDTMTLPDDYPSGVTIRIARNIKIENCIIDDICNIVPIDGSGIYSDFDSSDIYIGNCTISDASYGAWNLYGMLGNVHIYNCTVISCGNNNDLSAGEGTFGYSIKNCTVTQQQGHAISILAPETGAMFEVENNTCYNNYPYWALWMTYSSQSKICNNNFYNNGRGIMFQLTNNCSVFNNTVSYNDVGFYVWGSEQDHVFWNRFISNTEQYVFDSASPYWWNLTYYDGGGNYWSDYTGADIYSGEGQNETGRDYIGDTPYNIGTITDYYPLINASGWVNLTIPKVYNATVNETFLFLSFYEIMNETASGNVTVNGTIYNGTWLNKTVYKVNVTLVSNLTVNTTLLVNMTDFKSNDGYVMEDYSAPILFSAPPPPTTLPIEEPEEPEEPVCEEVTVCEDICQWKLIFVRGHPRWIQVCTEECSQQEVCE